MSARTYPRHVHARGGVYRITTSEPEYQQALTEGWADLPQADWPVPDVYVPWDGTPLTVVSPVEPRRTRRKATPPSES